jgi:hypothetical protein
MKNIEFVSKIHNILKLNNKDEHTSRRFILKVGRDVVKQLIAQKLIDKTILSENNLYTNISCIEFEKVDAKKCNIASFRLCRTLMKSKKPLPELVFGRGSSIRDVISLDGDYRFNFVDENQYRRNKARQHQIKNEVSIYLGTDNHLYIPDEEIYSVDLNVITLKTEEVDKTSSCAEDSCKSNWEYEFICPDKLIETVTMATLQSLGITRQIREDQNPNNVQGN